jgi:hypothetical protein
VLAEIFVDERREGEPASDPVPTSVLLQRSLQRRLRIRVASEAAALYPLRVAPARPIAVGPELAAVASNGCELEDLSLLDHENLLLVDPLHEPDRDASADRPHAQPCRQTLSLGSAVISAMSESDLQRRLAEALSELERLRTENEKLRALLALAQETKVIIGAGNGRRRTPTSRLNDASAAEKIALLQGLFRGRVDVYALRWENVRTGKSGYVPATAGGWTKTGPKTYLPLTDEAIARHLHGRESIGIYPLLEGDSCWFLACDLDGRTWQLDALALLEACSEREVPAALERSRSGDGGHVWIFFTAPVAASSARRLGALLLREAMARRAELDLASYDRLFPNQDFRPQKGFGNLIALPLQGRCRAAGTSVFLDPETMEPWPDQWGFLNSLERVSREQLEHLLDEHDQVAFGLEALSARWRARRDERVPEEVPCTIATDLAIPRGELPPSLLSKLKHLASLHNPLFYERQRLRLSTHRTPRLIRCYEEDLTHLHLPRGLLGQVEDAVARAGSRLLIEDRRRQPDRLPFEFRAELTPLQQTAVKAMLAHENYAVRPDSSPDRNRQRRCRSDCPRPRGTQDRIHGRRRGHTDPGTVPSARREPGAQHPRLRRHT